MAALQETHFRDTDPLYYRIAGYTWHTDNVNAQHRQGGAAILIANNVPHSRVALNTTINCVAVRLKIEHTQVTALSIYIPPQDRHTPSARELEGLVNQLPPPVLIMGDINAEHVSWSQNTNIQETTRSRLIDTLLNSHNLTVLNTGVPTRLNTRGQDRAIDLTCCSNTIHTLFEWEIESDPGPSDHYKITITLSPGALRRTKTHTPGWSLKRADWTKFEDTVNLALDSTAHPDISVILGAISSAAQTSVPKSKGPRRKASAPWWTPACNHAIAQRKRALKAYKRCICDTHYFEYRQAAANCKKVFKTEREKSWQSFASKFNRFTPTGNIWKLMKAFQLKRSPPGPFPTLNVNGQQITEPKIVMQHFAQHYAAVSANSSFPTTLKTRLENLANSCDFTSNNTEIYNQPFTLHELTHAISVCGNTSVGPDDIHYEFFRHLNRNALTYLLTAINELFTSHTFPARWRESIIIPIPKPNKDKQHPKSYRPISLTSCASKIVERMVNTRLKHYLETHDLLDPHQCGFRRGRSTTDNIMRLITDIRTGFHRRQTTVAAFLDISAAFDRVQKPAIIYKLHKLGLRGHLVNFITNFLTDRTFRVRCGTTYSPTTPQEQGLPQGSVLSPTLFLIMINDICTTAKLQVKYSLFADDVAIWATHKDLYRAESRVQYGLHEIALWCREWGFTLSAEKSASVTFTKTRTANTAALSISGQAVNRVKDFKFLGVRLDQHLTFNQHIKDIKHKCAKRINILRALTGTDWGGDRKTILQLYTAIIRPIIEYCSIAYNGGLTNTQHKQIEAIQNTCIRIATGAMIHTRVTTLLAEANMLSCQERRMQQLCRYAIVVKSTPNHPAQECFKPPTSLISRRNRTQHPPLSKQLDSCLNTFQFVIPDLAPRPNVKPFWLRPPPQVEYLFTEKKTDITPTEIQAKFLEYKAQHQNSRFIYTDGSKHDNKVGYALAIAAHEHSKRLPDNLSIFTAEASALLAAVQICNRHKLNNVIICSDSKSVLQALSNIHSPSHHIIAEIQGTLSQTRQITFLWIPGHASIPGNEKADQLAKQALSKTQTTKIQCPVADCLALLQQHMQQYRQQTWNDTEPSQFHTIKPRLGAWASSKQNTRLKEVTLTRLRTGRTRHNTPWLSVQQHNICAFCNTNIVPTVKHLLLECSSFDLHRRHIINFCRRENITLDIAQLLGDSHPELLQLLFQYLHDTKLIGAL